MGEKECASQSKYKPYKEKPDLNPTRAVWSATIASTGKFRCDVTGENSVSLETASTYVVVLDKPCNKPKLAWNGITDNSKDPTNTTRGKEYASYVNFVHRHIFVLTFCTIFCSSSNRGTLHLSAGSIKSLSFLS